MQSPYALIANIRCVKRASTSTQMYLVQPSHTSYFRSHTQALRSRPLAGASPTREDHTLRIGPLESQSHVERGLLLHNCFLKSARDPISLSCCFHILFHEKLVNFSRDLSDLNTSRAHFFFTTKAEYSTDLATLPIRPPSHKRFGLLAKLPALYKAKPWNGNAQPLRGPQMRQNRGRLQQARPTSDPG